MSGVPGRASRGLAKPAKDSKLDELPCRPLLLRSAGPLSASVWGMGTVLVSQPPGHCSKASGEASAAGSKAGKSASWASASPSVIRVWGGLSQDVMSRNGTAPLQACMCVHGVHQQCRCRVKAGEQHAWGSFRALLAIW